MAKDDKWGLFKQYMHNELGISKEDIRDWIKESVKDEANRLLRQETEAFNIKKYIDNIVYTQCFYSDETTLKILK